MRPWASLNSDSMNILTIENPIEYSIAGIGQTQVNEKADMTFARGLRAILRQDPDVVMVGEIRDFETAETAVQASLTGHLVMSTVHTNTAIGAVTRLVDMGVEPFLIASSVVGVLAQRLVRVLCPACKVAVEPDALAMSFLGRQASGPGDLPSGRLRRMRIFRLQGPYRHLRTGRGGRQPARDDSRPRIRTRDDGLREAHQPRHRRRRPRQGVFRRHIRTGSHAREHDRGCQRHRDGLSRGRV